MSGEAQRAQRRGDNLGRGIAGQAGEEGGKAEAAGAGERVDRGRPDEGHGVDARCMDRKLVEARARKAPEQFDQAPRALSRHAYLVQRDAEQGQAAEIAKRDGGGDPDFARAVLVQRRKQASRRILRPQRRQHLGRVDAFGHISPFQLAADEGRQAAFVEGDKHVVTLLAAQQRNELEAGLDGHARRHRKNGRFQRLAVAVFGEGDQRRQKLAPLSGSGGVPALPQQAARDQKQHDHQGERAEQYGEIPDVPHGQNRAVSPSPNMLRSNVGRCSCAMLARSVSGSLTSTEKPPKTVRVGTSVPSEISGASA